MMGGGEKPGHYVLFQSRPRTV